MLLRHYWRREVPGLLGWGVALTATVLPMLLLVQLILSSDGMQELTSLLEQLPPSLRAFMGGTAEMVTMNGWVTSQVFRTLAPLLLTLYTALGTLSILTKEMDGRTMDFLLSLPVRRSQVLLSRFLVLACNLGILHAVLLGCVGMGILLLGYQPDWQAYGLMSLNGYLVQLALAGLLLTATVFVDDYNRGLFTTIGAGLGLYFLPLAIESGSSLSWLRRLSFFAYAQPDEVIRAGAIPWADAVPLAVACVVLTVLAVRLFERKQLSA